MSTTVSVYLPDKEARRRVRRAAKLSGKPTAAFMREAILSVADATIEQHAEACPHCGTSKPKAAKAA